MDEDLLGCFLNGGGDLAFDELAAFEAGAGTDEGNEVGRVDGAPAGWAASISLKAAFNARDLSGVVYDPRSSQDPARPPEAGAMSTDEVFGTHRLLGERRPDRGR